MKQDNYKLIDENCERARVESIARERDKEQELIKVSNRLNILLFGGKNDTKSI